MKENTFFNNISQIWANMSFSRWIAKTANVREIKNGAAKGLAIIAVFSLVISSFSIPTTQATQVAPSFVDVCHKTGNGYNLLSINSNALSAHLAHGDVNPVPVAGCASLDVVAIPTNTVIVSGDTSAGENLPGWMFNRDTSTDTPFSFDTAAQSIGTGSLHVLPIGANASDKMIAENFINKPIADINGVAYDFKIGAGGDASKKDQFYMSVYANFGSSADLKYYDCRYSVVPTIGSTAGFTTVSFDPTQSYPVATRAGGDPSPFACPSIPADMDSLSSGSNIRMFALNVGDTSASDVGLDGYLDKVVVSTTTLITTYDFEPAAPKVPTTVNITKVWQDSTGTPINDPDNKTDISISVAFGNGGTSVCTYNAQGNLTCTNPISINAGDSITISETGVPSGYQVVASTVGNITPVCPDNVNVDHPCTATVINKLKVPAPCGTGLVGNSGFEKPVISNGSGWDAYPSGTPNLDWSAKWVRTNGGQPAIANAEMQSGVAGSPHGGNQLTELDSSFSGPATNSGSPDASIKLFQDLPTVPGKIYKVSVWTSPRPGTGPLDNRTEIKMGNTVLETVIEDGSNNSNTVWTKHSYTFNATSGLSRLSFTDLGVGNGLGGFIDDASVIQDCTSDVTICKYDNHQNPLEGWDVFLKGNKIDTVTVNPDGTDYSSVNLPAGDYLFVAKGTYVYRPGDPNASISDAAYSKRSPSDSVYGGAFAPWVRELDFPNPYTGWLGIQVDDANFNWAMSYDGSHQYPAFKTMASAGTEKFRILDDNYSDNSGSLTVDIYPIIKATTGQNGCVTLNNVQYGSYTLDEMMQDGWSNVSGQNTTVTVNSETENYSLTNKCDTNCTSHVTICKIDNNNHHLANWSVFLKGPKLETVNVNSNAIGGANSSNTLANGQQYLIVANGTWQNRGFETVDPKFTTPDGWTTVLDAPQGGYPNQLLELQTNQSFVSWGSYNTAHKYSYIATGNGSTANFRVFDGDVSTNTPDPNWYGDNNGTLSVDIYPIYSGVTGDDGCVTVDNVPYGSYKLDEIMKDGWSNVSGQGDTEIVNTQHEKYTLVNLCGPNGCAEDPCVAQDPSIASGIQTQFKGLATSLPADLKNESNYPLGVHAPAVAAGPTGYPGAWDGPQNDPDMTEGSAIWVSNNAIQPTNPAGAGGDGSIDTWRLFSHTFTIPVDATVISPAMLHFAADNSVTAFLDGVQIGINNNFANDVDVPLVLTAGTHQLKFAVKNDAFQPTNNPTGLIYNLDFTYCGSPTQQGEPHFHATGSKFNDLNGNGAKDVDETGISDWTIHLTHQIGADMSVGSDDVDGVDSPLLANGKTYIVKTTGTFDAGDNITADAQYSERNSNPNWTDLVQNYESYGPQLLDLQINGTSPNWGVYNSAHTYWTQLTGTGASVNFKIDDVYYPNNIGNLTVQIYEVNNTTVTAEDGSYSFDVSGMDGNYTIIEGMQQGWNQTFPETGIYTVAGSADSSGSDFGNHQVCIKEEIIDDSVFDIFISIVLPPKLPICGNGISGTKYKDGTENTVTLSGWVIYLDLDNDGQLDNNEPYDTTDEDGNYSFSNLPTGTYHVREVNQTGWTQILPANNGSNNVLVTDSVQTGINFTNKQDSGGGGGGQGFGISGNVYNDNNSNNGTKDSGEAGLAGWVIYLDADGSNTLNNEEKSTTSDSIGDYAFTGLTAGCYTVREVTQSNWNETEPAATEYTVGIGGSNCLVTLNGTTSDVALAAPSHWTDMFFKTAQAVSNPLNATGLNFGNIFLGGGGGSGGGSGGGGGGGSTPTPPVVGRVLGDSTNTPSDPTPQVLGATTELPRTGSPVRNLLALFLSLAVILTPTLISGKKKLKAQRI